MVINVKLDDIYRMYFPQPIDQGRRDTGKFLLVVGTILLVLGTFILIIIVLNQVSTAEANHQIQEDGCQTPSGYTKRAADPAYDTICKRYERDVAYGAETDRWVYIAAVLTFPEGVVLVCVAIFYYRYIPKSHEIDSVLDIEKRLP
jgi:hypothetical protein